MDPILIGLFAVIALLALIISRTPIAVSLLTVSFIGIALIIGLRPAISLMSTSPYNSTASWTLSSVPMFLLMGYVSYHSGLTRGLFNAARAWLSWLPGGLAIASLGGAGGFAAVTGSSIACSAAIGRIAIPEMHRLGYDPRISAGSVAAGGTIGALIPPSILLIIFGTQAKVSIESLFLGGFFVGSASLALYIAVVLIIAIRDPKRLPRNKGESWSSRWHATLDVWPIVLLIAIVFGGMFGGFFTATEAGAIGALFSILIGIVKGLNVEKFIESCTDTLLASGALFIIAVGANLFTRLVAVSGLSGEMANMINAMGLSVTGILIMIVLIYVVLGMFLEPIGAMLLTLPLFLPLTISHGVEPIWFGLLVAKMLEIGMITPPVGLNVFVIHSVAKDYVKLEQIFAGVVPFLMADFVLIAIMLLTRDLIHFG